MTTLRSAIADELDKRAQEFMSRHDDITYIQALRAVLPEENTMSKYTNPGAEVHARTKRYVELHQGTSYKEALNAVLASDKQLAEAYAQPMATTTPAVPITKSDEQEVRKWVLRALLDGMEGLLPGSLGGLALEASRFRKEGMTAEESTARAMSLFPDLVTGAKLLIADLRRNENTASYIVHSRAEALMQKHSELDYRAAVGVVLSEDPALKTAYVRS